MRVFAEQDLSAVLRAREHNLNQEVLNADRNYLLNVNETQYVDYLVGKWSVVPLELHFEAVSVSDYEKNIPMDQHPSEFFCHDGQGGSFPRHIVCYHLPVSGDTDLLNCRPSQWLMWSFTANLIKGHLTFEIIDWHNKPSDIKGRADHIFNNLKQQIQHLKADVDGFNARLSALAKNAFEERKKQLLAQLNSLAELGVPIRQTGGVPATFTVPVTPIKSVVKPYAPSQAFAPEPTLDTQTYDSVLKMIHDFGVSMERHPSIYAEKGEEALRDHFLMMLTPHFQSTTGETFNKSGKTDILIRHDGKNVFVAECKFWRGIKVFLSTIDQLLGYLTWRESKVAVIVFVDNKELNPVLEQIVAETPKHTCFVKDYGKKGDGWYQYEFHLKDDPSRGVKLALLCFHFPKLSKGVE